VRSLLSATSSAAAASPLEHDRSAPASGADDRLPDTCLAAVALDLGAELGGVNRRVVDQRSDELATELQPCAVVWRLPAALADAHELLNLIACTTRDCTTARRHGGFVRLFEQGGDVRVSRSR